MNPDELRELEAFIENHGFEGHLWQECLGLFLATLVIAFTVKAAIHLLLTFARNRRKP